MTNYNTLWIITRFYSLQQNSIHYINILRTLWSSIIVYMLLSHLWQYCIKLCRIVPCHRTTIKYVAITIATNHKTQCISLTILCNSSSNYAILLYVMTSYTMLLIIKRFYTFQQHSIQHNDILRISCLSISYTLQPHLAILYHNVPCCMKIIIIYYDIYITIITNSNNLCNSLVV